MSTFSTSNLFLLSYGVGCSTIYIKSDNLRRYQHRDNLWQLEDEEQLLQTLVIQFLEEEENIPL
jgi:hypothetical protein